MSKHERRFGTMASKVEVAEDFDSQVSVYPQTEVIEASMNAKSMADAVASVERARFTEAALNHADAKRDIQGLLDLNARLTGELQLERIHVETLTANLQDALKHAERIKAETQCDRRRLVWREYARTAYDPSGLASDAGKVADELLAEEEERFGEL